MADAIKVLLVDDHIVLAEGVQSLLSSVEGIEVIAMAHDGAHALTSIDELRPDVVLLDINLPDMDGMEVMEAIAERGYSCAVLALSMHEEEAFITGMMERGAKGYLLKNVSLEDLCDAIRTVRGGGTFYSKQVTQTLMDSIITRHRVPGKSDAPELSISDREKEVLQLIMQEHTTQEIAERLHISTNTVESHRRHLLEKLGARNSAGLVRIAMERGLVG